LFNSAQSKENFNVESFQTLISDHVFREFLATTIEECWQFSKIITFTHGNLHHILGEAIYMQMKRVQALAKDKLCVFLRDRLFGKT